MDREHPGQPLRPPAYAHLLIDSKDRDPNADRPPYEPPSTPANDFRIYRNQALLNGYFTRLAITQVEFNWRFATIIEGVNDTLALEGPATPPIQITISPGFYTPISLAAEIEAEIQAQGAPWNAFTVNWEPTTGGFVMETNNATDFYFLNPDVELQLSGDVAFAKSLSRTYTTVGVNLSNQDPTGNNEQLLSPPQFLWTRYVDICSRRLTKFQRVKDIDTAGTDTKSFIIARVYLCPPGQRTLISSDYVPGQTPFDICVDYNTPKHIKWSPQEAVNELDLQVYDEFGELLPWDGAYASWEYKLTLVASET